MSTLQQLLKGSKAERLGDSHLERKQAILSLQTLKLYYKAEMQKCRFISSHSCQYIMANARRTDNKPLRSLTSQDRRSAEKLFPYNPETSHFHADQTLRSLQTRKLSPNGYRTVKYLSYSLSPCCKKFFLFSY